ncbi:hypothetical protein [Spiroplasma endosymbiont of Labia minor]|uniref:hypothetical protein n=1 Tax=Spiroplasma endosymbiont of Labia minor TaxID=3066305 RepID=UPI0030CE1893
MLDYAHIVEKQAKLWKRTVALKTRKMQIEYQIEKEPLNKKFQQEWINLNLEIAIIEKTIREMDDNFWKPKEIHQEEIVEVESEQSLYKKN